MARGGCTHANCQWLTQSQHQPKRLSKIRLIPADSLLPPILWRHHTLPSFLHFLIYHIYTHFILTSGPFQASRGFSWFANSLVILTYGKCFSFLYNYASSRGAKNFWNRSLLIATITVARLFSEFEGNYQRRNYVTSYSGQKIHIIWNYCYS